MRGLSNRVRPRLALLSLATLAFAAPASAQQAPAQPLEQLLVGHFLGKGEFIDKRGGKNRGIDLDIRGSYDGRALTLVEDTTFSDGEQQHKVWTFTRKSPTEWTGTRSDVIGAAAITIDGPTIRMVYKAHVPKDGKTWDLKFDEHYEVASPDLIRFRADVSYLFFTVGEATLTIRRAGK